VFQDHRCFRTAAVSGPLLFQDRGDHAEDPGVGVDLGAGPRGTACPACGAALRPDAPWCTLCFADLCPAPGPAAARAPAPAADPASAAARAAVAVGTDDARAGTQPVAPVLGDGPSWPCSRCAAANGYERDTCRACGASFLAAVKDDEAPLLVLPGVGDLSRLGRPQRLLLALGVVLAVLVPLAVITLLLTQRPPVAGTTHGPPGASVPSVPAAP